MGGSVRAKPYERPLDQLDAMSSGATVDMHDDAALHHRPLDGGDHPSLMSAVWAAGVDATSVFVPNLRNFHRHVTRETLDHAGRGVQVFSAVTKGFPVVPTVSHDAYTGIVANWPTGANDTALNAWIWQAAWTYRQVEENRDRLVLARTAADAVNAIKNGKIAAQLGIEGGFPFDAAERDLPRLRKFIAEHRGIFPRSFPLPTESELKDRRGLLSYAFRIGEQYVGLSHLVSSCYAGGGPWPSKGEGLSNEGRAMVREMNDIGIMLDLAHASPRAQQDIIEMVNRGEYTLPLIVSHGLLPVTGKEPAWRITSPASLDAVKKTGGIVGIIGARAHLPSGNFKIWDVLDKIFFWPFRLFGLNWHCPGWTNPEEFIDDMVDQMDYIRDRIGIDHVGLGLDGDGFVGLPYKNYAEMQDALRKRMKERGYSQGDIDKVFAGNYLHVLKHRDDLLAQRMRHAQVTAKPPAVHTGRPTKAAK